METKMLSFLKKINQVHLYDLWKDFSDKKKQSSFIQIQKSISSFLSIEKKEKNIKKGKIVPLSNSFLSGSQYLLKGKNELLQGKVGIIVLAGGQATRLGGELPKGMYPVSLVKNKSLFQLLCEKIEVFQGQIDQKIPICIMTSPANHEMTLSFFESHQFFGLNKSQIFFFCQKNLPLFDQEGKFFWTKEGVLAEGPEGNGGVFEAFYDQGGEKFLQDKTIETFMILPIDNPLGDPFDLEFIGFHSSRKNQITIKCFERSDEKEHLGVLAIFEDKLGILEYTDIESELYQKKDRNQKFIFSFANSGIFCMDRGLIEEWGVKKSLSFYHTIEKKADQLYQENGEFKIKKVSAFRYERFIFEKFTEVNQVEGLCYPRYSCYAPLKSPDGLKLVKSLLLSKDQKLYNDITGIKTEDKVFELSMDFHYPSKGLSEKYQGRPIENGSYIE